MTYQERLNKVCEECGQSEVCGFYLRDLQRRCGYLQNVEYGWELGQQDTLEAIEDYIDQGNSVATEEFMAGLKEHLKD